MAVVTSPEKTNKVNILPVHITLWEEQLDEVDQLAMKWRTSRSGAIRRVIDEWQDQQKKGRSNNSGQ